MTSMIEEAWEMKEAPPSPKVGDTAPEDENKQPEVPSTNIRTGLSSHEVQGQLEKYGFNEIEEDEAVHLWKLFVMELTNYMIILLIIAAIASFALQQIPEGIAIVVIIVLNASIAVYTEKSAANALAALSDMSQPSSTVLRDGETMTIPTREVVVGEVILIEAGDIVSADALLVASADLKVNEMPLTGEPTDVNKTHGVVRSDNKALTPPNQLFSGTTVTAGTGLAIVFATGMHTRVGRIAALLSGADVERNWLGVKPPKLTPLQRRLKAFGLLLSAVAITAAIIVFFVGSFAQPYRDPENPGQEPVLEMVLVAVTLAVSAIPESLPLCVTVVLAVGTQQMAKHENCLVRHIPAVETLGSAQIVCSDKTGTLTEGKMTALKVWCLGNIVSAEEAEERDIKVTGQGLLPVGELVENGQTIQDPGYADVQVSTCIAAGVLNSTALLKMKDRDAGDDLRSLRTTDVQRNDFSSYALLRQWVAEGNTTEVPIVVLGGKVGIFRVLLSRDHPSIGVERGAKVGAEVPFSSDRKVMISVVRANDTQFHKLQLPLGTNYAALIKGAPNYVIDNCKTAIYKDESFAPFRDDGKRRVTRAVDDLSNQALRVLAVAIRPLEELPYDPTDSSIDAQQKFELLNNNLTFAGLIASLDPEREGVSHAIQVAKKAGVQTVMITGDYLKTAIAIAKNIGLITFDDDPENVAIDCKHLRPYGDEYLVPHDMDEITTRCVVFARAQPADKLEIVKSLRRQGLVTGMTGDGVNDAPAMHEANIGIAMGINGTEVAKAASDMVLLDDNFVTLVAAIRKGRQIYANVQKFVMYFIGTNAATMTLIMLGVFAGIPVPFLPLVILFLNLAIDGTCSMSIAVQPPEERIMDDEPRPLKEPLITGRMWFVALSHALVLLIVVGASYLIGLYWFTGSILTSDLLDGDKLRHHCSVYQGDGTYETVSGSDCIKKGLAEARTMAFITVVFSETLRAFTIKSLSPLHVDFFDNHWLLVAAAVSATLAILIVLVPGLSDVFSLVGLRLPYWAWLTALALAVLTVVYDEFIKYRVRRAEKKHAQKQKIHNFFTTMQGEMRQLRRHLVDLETHLKLREERPSRNVVLQESAKALAHALAVHRIGNEQVYQMVPEAWTQSTYRENVLHDLTDPEASATTTTTARDRADSRTARSVHGTIGLKKRDNFNILQANLSERTLSNHQQLPMPPKKAAPAKSSGTRSSSSGAKAKSGSVTHVHGHTRTTASGKKAYVRPHVRHP